MNEKTVLTHSWERYGYKAPYRITGLWSAPAPALAEQNPQAYNAALSGRPVHCRGACDVCGMGIMHHYIATDADGKIFTVGSDCVLKADDTKLISEMMVIKNKVARDAAKAKRDAKREADRVAYNLQLEQERARNGGLTDYEVNKIAEAAEYEAKKQAFRDAHLDLVAALDESDFGRRILNQFMESNQFPQNRALDICADIFAKYHGGRAGSKAYEAQYDRFLDRYEHKQQLSLESQNEAADGALICQEESEDDHGLGEP
jgi:hypothetical protein